MRFGHEERSAALVWGSEPPAHSIGYEKPLGPTDSGFSVLFADAPDPEELDEAPDDELPPGLTLVCLQCLVDDHPEIGRGLDIAREHGVADLDESGVWIVGNLNRLEPG
jgi:hypothetical protein